MTWNRLQNFKNCLDSFVKRTESQTYELIICDNGSLQPGMPEYLKGLESKFFIIYNNGNMKHKGWRPGIRLARERYGKDTNIIISDPDIELPATIPPDWPWILQGFLDHHSTLAKVGMAADIWNLPEGNVFRRSELGWGYWSKKFETDFLPDPCYYAPLSTSTAMVRPDTFTEDLEVCALNNHKCNSKWEYYCVRIAGRFAYKHYWATQEKFPDDFNYLLKLKNSGASIELSGSFCTEIGMPTRKNLKYGFSLEGKVK